jgi:branched-chain amino acid transport system substrate-binding protein
VTTIDRRRFLKLAGASAGLAAARTVLPSSAWAGSGLGVRVGVIVPTGASYTDMGSSLFAGLQLGADEDVGSPRVAMFWSQRTVERGYGGAFTAAQELLDEGVDVVVAGITAPVARQLAPTFEERGVPLVVANVGAHLVRPAARSPFVLHNSLQYWRASYAAGAWSAATLGRRAMIAASLADSGYDTLYAFARGFEANGGSVLDTLVTHERADAGLAGAFEAIAAASPDVVHGLYTGPAAVEFVRGYAKAGLRPTPLVVGALACEEFLLGGLGRSAIGVRSAASWTRSRATEANQAFVAAYSARGGRAPDPFAALGYDTAMLVAEGARRAVAGGGSVRGLIDALHGVRLVGPRGRLTIDTPTNSIVTPLAIREVRRVDGERCNVEIAKASAGRSIPAALEDLVLEPASGFINECLCA